MPQKERCLRCDKSWTRADDEPRHPCLACGETRWDQELDLAPLVASGREYEIYDERVDSNMILTLGLLGLDNESINAWVPLSHRLKEKFRHQQGDLRIKDSRDLIVKFECPTSGPDRGRWIIHSRLRPKWLQARDRLRENAGTSRALLAELGVIQNALETVYDSNLLSIPNWFNFLPTISIATYDELRGLGRVVELGADVSRQVNQLYESVKKVNDAVATVNRELTVNRAKATQDPGRHLQNLWLPAHFAKQEFLSKYPTTEALLLTVIGKSRA